MSPTQPDLRQLDEVATPIGVVALVTNEAGAVCACGFVDNHRRMAETLQRYDTAPAFRLVRTANPGGVSSAVRAYFDGELAALDAIPVEIGGTAFEAAVWRALRRIPCGQTRSYRDMAEALGRPRAVRAIGMANGKNPAGLIVPCHRVIGADGSLTGYGGGLERKRWLLRHEGALPVTASLPFAAPSAEHAG